MIGWEYKAHRWNTGIGEDHLEAVLNVQGRNGWELVAVCLNETWVTYYFKRQIISSNTAIVRTETKT